MKHFLILIFLLLMFSFAQAAAPAIPPGAQTTINSTSGPY